MSGVPDYTLEDTLDFKFTTRQFSSGAPFAFASGAVEIYEDNSITQITGAETLTLEFDGIAGLHNLRVAATAANGFENGKSYHCVVSVGTVDSVSVVGEVVQQFSIGRSAAAADLANGTDGLTALKTGIDGIPTAAAIADAVQDEPIEDHDTQGNVGWATALAVYAGSDGPGIYVDSGAANTSTTVGTDGTEINPVSTFAAARTLADALGLKIYYLEGNSDATLAATHVDWEFIGIGSVMDNIVNLGSQDVSRSLFRNLVLEGTQGGAGRVTARDCALQDPGAGDTTLHIFAERCGFVDRIQVDTSADNVFDQCYSLVAGVGAPVIQATGAAGTISVRHYSGGMEFETLSASHNVTWEGIGQVIFNADCNVNANVSVRGIGSITDNTAGMSSLTETSLVNMTKINAEVDTALTDIHLDHLIAEVAADIPVDGSIIAHMVSATEDWSTFVPSDDSLQAIRDHIGNGSNLTEAGGTGDHLTAINLPNQTMDITGSLSGSVGSVTGAVGSVTGAVGSVAGNVDGNVTGSVGSLAAQAKADVNAEVVDVMDTDIITLPGQTAPPLTPTHRQAIAWLYKVFRNRKTQTATQWSLLADDEATVDAKATVSDDTTTATKQEVVTGP